MKMLPVLSLFLLSAAASIAQTVRIPGYATLQNSGGQSAFPLEISVSEGASIVKTNPETGYFELSCPAQGDYFLTLNKAGYEVVNPRTLQLFFHEKKANIDTLQITLNAEGAWLDLADRYFRSGMTIATQAHQSLLAELQKNTQEPDLTNQAYRQALDALAFRAIAAFTQVSDAAEHTAQSNADAGSPAYRKALRFFGEGKAAEALQALAAAKSPEELALRARLQALSLNETAARTDYEAAHRLAPADFQLAREYIRYLLLYPEHVGLSRLFWEKILPAAHHDNDRATCLQGIGAAAGRTNNTREAIQFFEQAAQLRKPLAAAHPFFGPDYAYTCRALGNLLMGAGNHELARARLEEAAAVWTNIPNACGFTYCMEPALVNWMLAGYNTSVGAIDQGLSNAAADYERLAEHYTTASFLRKATVLSSIAQQRQNRGEAAGASAAWREMASIFEEYEAEWPFFIEQERHTFWSPMALAAQPASPGGDEWLLSKGIDRLRSVVPVAPAFFELPLAYCLNSRGLGQMAAGKNDASLQDLQEAKKLTEPYILQRPADAVPIYTFSCGNLGDLFAAKQEFKLAAEQFDQGIALLQACSQCDPFIKNTQLAALLQGSGRTWFMQEQPLKSLEQFYGAIAAQRLVLAAATNPQSVYKALAILSLLTYTQINLTISSGEERYKTEAKKSIAEAESLLNQFPKEPAFDQFRQQFTAFKAGLTD